MQKMISKRRCLAMLVACLAVHFTFFYFNGEYTVDKLGTKILRKLTIANQKNEENMDINRQTVETKSSDKSNVTVKLKEHAAKTHGLTIEHSTVESKRNILSTTTNNGFATVQNSSEVISGTDGTVSKLLSDDFLTNNVRNTTVQTKGAQLHLDEVAKIPSSFKDSKIIYQSVMKSPKRHEGLAQKPKTVQRVGLVESTLKAELSNEQAEPTKNVPEKGPAKDLTNNTINNRQDDLIRSTPKKGLSEDRVDVREKTPETGILINRVKISTNTNTERRRGHPAPKKEIGPKFLKLNHNCSTLGINNPYCLKYDYKRLISPKWNCGGHVTVVITITSVPSNISRRNVLRRTWCSDLDDFNITVNGKQGSMRHMFVIGKTKSAKEQLDLEKEAKIHGDIIQDDFVESYRNMTLKTILAFRWFDEHCKNVSFLMKTDDDMFIDSYNLVRSLLQKENAYRNALFGHCYPYGKVVRSHKHRWFVSKQQFGGKYFPKYCAGTGYIIGSLLAHKVAKIMADVPIFPIEDAYVGLCVNYLKGGIFHKLGFNIGASDHSIHKFKDLIQSHKLMTVHKANDTLIEKLWRIVTH